MRNQQKDEVAAEKVESRNKRSWPLERQTRLKQWLSKGGQQTLREAAAMLVIREEQGKELIGTTFYRSRGWLAWKEKGDSGVLKCWPTRDCSLVGFVCNQER